jgi:hypothetical protein
MDLVSCCEVSELPKLTSFFLSFLLTQISGETSPAWWSMLFITSGIQLQDAPVEVDTCLCKKKETQT